MLKGKTVIVTGGTSGIGLGIAKKFADANCNVVINGFGDLGEIKEITNELSRRTSGQAVHCSANLASLKEIEGFFKTLSKLFKSFDILINNAGIQHVAPIEEFPADKWQQVIDVNLSGVFHMSRIVLPFMRKAKWGRIINIASTHGLVASEGKAAYVAAKHGVLGLTKVVALETAKENITCNAICPGWVLTPLVQKQIEKRAQENKMSVKAAQRELLSEKQPSLEFVTPEQIAEYCAFLCTDAAEQITGASLTMDGGWTIV